MNTKNVYKHPDGTFTITGPQNRYWIDSITRKELTKLRNEIDMVLDESKDFVMADFVNQMLRKM